MAQLHMHVMTAVCHSMLSHSLVVSHTTPPVLAPYQTCEMRPLTRSGSRRCAWKLQSPGVPQRVQRLQSLLQLAKRRPAAPL